MRYKVLIPPVKKIKDRKKTQIHFFLKTESMQKTETVEAGEIEGTWLEFDMPDEFEYIYDRQENKPGTFNIKITNGEAYTFPVPQKLCDTNGTSQKTDPILTLDKN